MRAILNKYDPYKQVEMRLRALVMTGHPTDKIELRIIGGTWSFYPKKYQEWFVGRCFAAANCNNTVGVKSLQAEQKYNETAKYRIIGLSIETRPDFVNDAEIKRLRKLGVTMVELGVQSIYDDILKLIKRGHGRKEIIRATELLKDAGFKICYQMMPNLPGSSIVRDKKMFIELFSNPDFRPDMLKIYPCALLKETPLYNWWKNKKYKPYTSKQLIGLMKTVKKLVPPYVRIQRITRDIPSQSIVVGPAKISNLRQMIAGNCRCIRCREIKGNYNPKEKLRLFRQDYHASGGEEIFLSFENKNRTKLYSLLRLRLINSVKSRSAIIREVHTYGKSLEVGLHAGGLTSTRSPQHKGLGKKLILEAEKISKKSGVKTIKVISGIGAREYYRKLGYRLEKTYMIKNLKS